MTPPWGINWLRYHGDGTDMPHIERMGYASFTIYEWMWNNRDFCNELLSVARQDAIFLNRDHPLSEQKDDLWKSDPAQKGRNHADEWAQKVREGKVYTPLDRTYFLGLNEPDSNHYQRQIDAYNEAYCRRMAEHGLRVAAYSFGVGHPSTVDQKPDTEPDWSWYDASAAAILEGNHIAAFHEYGAPTVGGYGWGFWCNRVAYCPHPFDAIMDENGIDNGVLQSGQLYGYAKYMSGEQYADWLDAFQRGMAERASTRKVKLKSYNIFSYDHGSGESKDWHSFDIRPMRSILESYQWSVAPITPPLGNGSQTITTHLPNINNATVPGQPPLMTNFDRAMIFIRRWEGGYVDDPNDPGGATNKGVTIGTFTRWRESRGLPTPTKDDLRNLTDAEATQIYRDWYWLASGADKLAWPLALAQMDTAVNAGVGRANEMLDKSGGSFLLYMAELIDWYTRIPNFEHFGRAWMRRRADLLREAAKS